MCMYMFLMRDEKEERKKQARSNKQTRQSNTAHPRQSLVYTCILRDGLQNKCRMRVFTKEVVDNYTTLYGKITSKTDRTDNFCNNYVTYCKWYVVRVCVCVCVCTVND